MAYAKIHNKGDWRHEEAAAAGTIKPGMLCERTSAGKVQAHSNPGGRAERLVALEDALQGRGVATNYSIHEVVTLALPVPGTVMNMLMQIGDSGDIGDEVISAGDGTLISRDNAPSPSQIKQTIGYLEEAYTTLAANTLKAVRFV